MIRNPERLWQGVPKHGIEEYKLRVLKHCYLDRIAKVFDMTVTSAYRTQKQQENLRDASGNLIPPSRKAKSISQHVLAEAADFVCDNMVLAYKMILDMTAPWQLILYIRDGQAKSIHLSMPSELKTIEPKLLLKVDDEWQFFRGDFPISEGT